jgi:glycosyltransferase involved in cell wall biosynthesis
MEALSAGVPVIAPEVGGVPEAVSDKHNGLLLRGNASPSEIAAAIETFVNMAASEYQAYSAHALATWSDKFNAGVNYPRFVRDICEGSVPVDRR